MDRGLPEKIQKFGIRPLSGGPPPAPRFLGLNRFPGGAGPPCRGCLFHPADNHHKVGPRAATLNSDQGSNGLEEFRFCRIHDFVPADARFLKVETSFLPFRRVDFSKVSPKIIHVDPGVGLYRQFCCAFFGKDAVAGAYFQSLFNRAALPSPATISVRPLKFQWTLPAWFFNEMGSACSHFKLLVSGDLPGQIKREMST